MKSLLKVLYFLLVLVILILLAGIFLPKENHIESNISVKASPEIVFEQINTLKNWEKWSPWFYTDSTMIPIYNGIPAGTGASFSWKSTSSGEGKLTISESEPLRRIETVIDFGIRGKSNTSFILKNERNETIVTWVFENKNLGYFERYFMILFKKNMLTTLNSGLQNIKNICQELQLDRISEIKLVDISAQPAMGIIDSSSIDQMGAKMAKMYSKLSIYLEKRGIQPVGPAFTIYYNWNPKGLTRFACCLPIAERTWGWKEYSYIELTQGQAATLTHWGKYGTSKPYEALDKYFRENSLRKGTLMWEVCKNDPSIESDTSKWEVQIFYPIKYDN
jgi:effector-binding domain-containing protein